MRTAKRLKLAFKGAVRLRKICYVEGHKAAPSTLLIDPSALVDQEDKLQHIKYKISYINKVIQLFYSLKLDSYLPKKASFVSFNDSPT